MKICSKCGRPILPFVAEGRAVTGRFATRREFRQAVLNMLEAGKAGREVAKEMGVSESVVSRIKHGDRKQTYNGYRVPTRPIKSGDDDE